MLNPRDYPGHIEMVENTIAMFKQVIGQIVYRETGTFPDNKGMAELIHVFYFLCIGVPQILPEDAQVLVPIFEKHMAKQIEITREGLVHISHEVLEDGAQQGDIITYLYSLFVLAFKKHFPKESLLKLE